MSEKRKFIRFNILMDAIARRGSNKKNLKINNFSREGVGLLTDEKIPQGEDVEVELSIPGDNIPVIISGQIAWTEEAPAENGKHKSGLRFKEIQNSDRTRILHHIYEKWLAPNEKQKEAEK